MERMTGTGDEIYNMVAVLYHALQGAENCRTYADDAADDQELRRFFEEAGERQRELADRGKVLLHDRLMDQIDDGRLGAGGRDAGGREAGEGGSAFGFDAGGDGTGRGDQAAERAGGGDQLR